MDLGSEGLEQLVVSGQKGRHCATSVDGQCGRAWVENAAGSVPQQA